MSEEIANLKVPVVLTAQQAEFILGSLDSVVKAHGMTHAASALTVAHVIQEAFKKEGVTDGDEPTGTGE